MFFALEAGGEAQSVTAAAFGFGAIPVLFGNDAAQGAGYLTLLTYAFVHGDFWHLAGNMLFLWVFGDNVEDAMGHWRFVVFYLLCAVAAAVVHIAMLPGSAAPVIGASGAIAGVVAAYLMLHPHVRIWILVLGRIPLPVRAFWVLGGWIAFRSSWCSRSMTTGSPGGAHIGGLVAGRRSDHRDAASRCPAVRSGPLVPVSGRNLEIRAEPQRQGDRIREYPPLALK